MATYTLTLIIDSKIMAKESPYNLNIAKKVNDVFTTAFRGASIVPMGKQQQLLQINVFSWREEYSVFLSVDYSAGMQVSAATLPRPINFGQKATFAKGILSEAEKADQALFSQSNSSNTFLLCHVPDNLKASVSCKVGDKWAPIYVDNINQNGMMDKQLTPLNEYSLFWDSKVTTSTMIDYARTSEPFEFSFEPNQTTKVLRYGYKTQDSPAGAEQPEWYPGQLS